MFRRFRGSPNRPGRDRLPDVPEGGRVLRHQEVRKRIARSLHQRCHLHPLDHREPKALIVVAMWCYVIVSVLILTLFIIFIDCDFDQDHEGVGHNPDYVFPLYTYPTNRTCENTYPRGRGG